MVGGVFIMRDQLKKISESDYWVYGLREDDFDYTIRLVQDFIKSRKDNYQTYAAKVRAESPNTADDILDDIAYYTHVDIDYMWHFCLWRLQGIFEGLITSSFLPSKPKKRLIGLEAKVNAMKTAGYQLSDDDFNELVLWANLRNALSHSPPEQCRPGPLQENDVMEYLEFLKKLCRHFRGQEPKIKKGSP
jgi:hypothetical protein